MLKKLVTLLFAVCGLFMFTSCVNTSVDVSAIVAEAAYHPVRPAERTTLRVGVVPGPYVDMFMEYIEPILAAGGYSARLVHFDDFTQPNLALAAGEIDLNVFQHTEFMNNFKFAQGVDISAVAEVPTVSMGIFSTRFATLDDVPQGAVVVLPDDATNLARALRVLEATGLIMLNPLADRSTVTEADIVRNPREFDFNRMDASLAVGALAANDMAIITGGFAYAGGLDIASALYNEILTDGLKIVIAVRTEDLGRQFTRSILDAVHSNAFKDAITSDASIFSGFQRPTYLLLHTGGTN